MSCYIYKNNGLLFTAQFARCKIFLSKENTSLTGSFNVAGNSIGF